MLGNNHSTTSTPMSDMACNVFIIGKNYLSPSHCSIGTFIKSSQSTHNIFSFRANLFSFSSYIIPHFAGKCQEFIPNYLILFQISFQGQSRLAETQPGDHTHAHVLQPHKDVHSSVKYLKDCD